MAKDLKMSRRRQLRRVVVLCRAFAWNLAFYRAGQREQHKFLFDRRHAGANFWRVVNGNCIDICVLEWCKLFADEKADHHWGRIVTDPATFKQALLTQLGINEVALKREIEEIRHYRDKFVAHLDSEPVMTIPRLDRAKQSVWFYHAHIVGLEANKGDLTGLPMDLDAAYAQAEEEAATVYRAGITGFTVQR